MEKKNKFGRSFISGKSLGKDFRSLIIDRCLELGGNVQTKEIPTGIYTRIAMELKVSDKCVRKMWLQYCDSRTVSPEPHRGGPSQKLSDPDIEYLLAMKKEKPSISYSEMRDRLLQHSNIPGGNISLSVIGDVVRNKFNMSFKRLTRVQKDRFSAHNLRYTQAFIDHIQTLQPDRVLFMDESGFQLTVGHRSMGHSKVGTRCMEISRYHPSPNISLLAALDGPRFYNFVDGPSNTGHYVHFFTDASHGNIDKRLPCISAGDTIVVHNCPLHHNQPEVLL